MNTTTCRAKALVRYFGEELDCDGCHLYASVFLSLQKIILHDFICLSHHSRTHYKSRAYMISLDKFSNKYQVISNNISYTEQYQTDYVFWYLTYIPLFNIAQE